MRFLKPKTKAQMAEAKVVAKLFAQLMQSDVQHFPQAGGRLNATDKRGVYVIYGPRDSVLHVGSTPYAANGVAQRLKGHLASRSSFVGEYFNKDGSRLRAGCKFRCLAVANPRKRALLEAYAIGHLCPAHVGCGI